MTDDHDPLDELASAHLDDETTPEEAARLAADPDRARRLARLTAARDAVRSPVPPVADLVRDQAVAAALAAADEVSPSGAHPGGAVPLARVAARRGRRRALQLAGIAAAVAALALAVPLLGSLDSGSTDGIAAPPERAALDASKDATVADSAAGLGATEQATTGAAPADDLGSFDDLPGLTEAVRARLSSPAESDGASTRAAAGGPTTCSTEPDRDGTVVFGAIAAYEGRDVVVLVREDPAGGRTLVVLDRADCSKLAGGKL